MEKESIEHSKNILNELSNKLERYKSMLIKSEETEIKHHISTAIIEKLLKVFQELEKNEKDLHKQVATLRYTLETLIVTCLLIQENDYFLKMYYALYEHQENKRNLMIKRVEKELELLREYTVKYAREKENNKQLYMGYPRKMNDENERIFQFYKEQIQKHINIYFHEIEKLGFENSLYLLENEILKQYQNELKEFEQVKINRAKHLSKQEWFKKYFDVNKQHSKVFKSLKDKRSWEEKARLVNLIDEYKLNYERTSSLLHFNSYSLFTSNEIDNDEIHYNYQILNQYVSHIITNISAFSRVMMFDLFNMVDVS